jgi:predicted dehydrogenase
MQRRGSEAADMRRRILLLGLGFWGRNWYSVITRSTACTLVGVAGGARDLEALGIAGSDGPRPYTDYRDAIDREDADAVVIVLPTALHVEAGMRALDKGLHVLSEKPIASDLAGAALLRAAARRRPSQVYMINQNYRWRSHNRTLRQAIASGIIGTPGSVHLEFRQPEFLVGDRPGLEMPLIQDMSIHHFDLLRFLLDADAVEVFARAFRPSWSHYSGLASTEAVIEMANGVIVGYSGTWAGRGRYTLWDGDVTVTGSLGCLKLDGSGEVRLYPDAGQDPGAFSGFEGHEEMGRILDLVPSNPDELGQTLDAFLEGISAGVAPSTCLEDNFHSFAMVAAAEESARTGVPVAVAS